MGTATAPVRGSGCWPVWMARVSKSMAASLSVHRRQAELAGKPPKRPLERLGAAEATLGMPRLRRQRACRPVGLDVGPADDAVVGEDGQDVVAVAPLRGGLVHLDQ